MNNMQAIIKQAQKMQKEMMEQKRQIDEKEFTAKSSIVTVTAMGNKKIKSIKIDSKSLEEEDIEMLQDMILVAVNDVLNQIDKETEEKMGKNLQGIPGLF